MAAAGSSGSSRGLVVVRVEGPSGEKKLLGRLEVDVVGVVVGREGEVKLGSNSGQAGLQTKGELLSCLVLSCRVVSARCSSFYPPY